MIWSRFLEILTNAKSFLGKRAKNLKNFFRSFITWKNVQLSACSTTMQKFSSFGTETKRLLALQMLDGFLDRAGPCRAGPVLVASLIEYGIHSKETSFTSFSRNNS